MFIRLKFIQKTSSELATQQRGRSKAQPPRNLRIPLPLPPLPLILRDGDRVQDLKSLIYFSIPKQ